MRGTHVAEPEVVAEQVPSVRLRFRSPPAYEADGEYRRATTPEIEVSCVPRALRVVVAGDTAAHGASPA
jgi:diacylglycerol kinase family enzyme